MTYTFTNKQVREIKDALIEGNVDHRRIMAEAIEAGRAGEAGYAAKLITRNERAQHVCWDMMHHWPTPVPATVTALGWEPAPQWAHDAKAADSQSYGRHTRPQLSDIL